MSKQTKINNNEYIVLIKNEFTPTIIGKKLLDIEKIKKRNQELGIQPLDWIKEDEQWDYVDNYDISLLSIDDINNIEKMKMDYESSLLGYLDKEQKFKEILKARFNIEYNIVLIKKEISDNDLLNLLKINDFEDVLFGIYNQNFDFINVISRINSGDLLLLLDKSLNYRFGIDFFYIINTFKKLI